MKKAILPPPPSSLENSALLLYKPKFFIRYYRQMYKKGTRIKCNHCIKRSSLNRKKKLKASQLRDFKKN